MKHRILIVTVAATVLFAAACTGNSPIETEVVEVKLLNWAIEPEVTSVEAGRITFRAIHEVEDHAHGGGNEGGDIHELAIAKKGADGTSEILGTAANIGVGKQKDLTLNLKSGEYELQCNVVEMIDGEAIAHYPKGMHTTFTVT